MADYFWTVAVWGSVKRELQGNRELQGMGRCQPWRRCILSRRVSRFWRGWLGGGLALLVLLGLTTPALGATVPSQQPVVPVQVALGTPGGR